MVVCQWAPIYTVHATCTFNGITDDNVVFITRNLNKALAAQGLINQPIAGNKGLISELYVKEWADPHQWVYSIISSRIPTDQPTNHNDVFWANSAQEFDSAAAWVVINEKQEMFEQVYGFCTTKQEAEVMAANLNFIAHRDPFGALILEGIINALQIADGMMIFES